MQEKLEKYVVYVQGKQANILFGSVSCIWTVVCILCIMYKKQGLDHIGICLKFRVRGTLKVKYFDQGHLNSI